MPKSLQNPSNSVPFGQLNSILHRPANSAENSARTHNCRIVASLQSTAHEYSCLKTLTCNNLIIHEVKNYSFIMQRFGSSGTFGADGDEFDAFALDEVERLGDVGDAVEPHLALVGLRQLLAGDHLEQQHQLEPVAKVLLDHVDLRVHLPQVRVAPRRERLHRPTQQSHTSVMPAASQMSRSTTAALLTCIIRLGSRVVSVLDSGAEGPGFKSQW